MKFKKVLPFFEKCNKGKKVTNLKKCYLFSRNVTKVKK